MFSCVLACVRTHAHNHTIFIKYCTCIFCLFSVWMRNFYQIETVHKFCSEIISYHSICIIGQDGIGIVQTVWKPKQKLESANQAIANSIAWFALATDHVTIPKREEQKIDQIFTHIFLQMLNKSFDWISHFISVLFSLFFFISFNLFHCFVLLFVRLSSVFSFFLCFFVFLELSFLILLLNFFFGSQSWIDVLRFLSFPLNWSLCFYMCIYHLLLSSSIYITYIWSFILI